MTKLKENQLLINTTGIAINTTIENSVVDPKNASPIHGRVCRLVKLRISKIRTFSFGNISHITLYAQLEIVWKVSELLRKYWGNMGKTHFIL